VAVRFVPQGFEEKEASAGREYLGEEIAVENVEGFDVAEDGVAFLSGEDGSEARQVAVDDGFQVAHVDLFSGEELVQHMLSLLQSQKHATV
jgi:hypothetical protein